MGIFGMKIEKASSKKKEEIDYNKVNNEINGDTTFVGDITSKANLRIRGTIKGKVTTDNAVFIQGGTVEGNIFAPRIDNRGNVKANINYPAIIHLHKDSNFVGNITCKAITISGNYEGNINAEKVIITASAKMKGSVTTKTISIAENPNLEVQFKIVETNKKQENEAVQ